MADATPVVALYGATALGKSSVAFELAAALEADIVVADSMQVYAGLPIVTNQPDAEALSRRRHHLVGFVAPQREFTVAEFARRAHDVIDGLLRDGRRVIVEGGSGLYLRAALGDLAFGEPPAQGLRARLEQRWAHDPEELVRELQTEAPELAARVDMRNARRVIRALESAAGRETARRDPGAAASTAAGVEQDRLWLPGERYPHRLFALVPDDDRVALKARIGERVDEMLSRGALDEVAAARAAGPFSRTAAQAIGVRELGAVLDGELCLDEAATRMKARTRALARRQLTWMRKLPEAAAVPAASSPVAVAAEVCHLLRSGSW